MIDILRWVAIGMLLMGFVYLCYRAYRRQGCRTRANQIVRECLFFLAFAIVSIMYAISDARADWELVEVYDGDTIKLSNEEHKEPFDKISLRVLGIDTPEKGWRAECNEERIMAMNATQALRNAILGANVVRYEFVRWGKWGGRVLGHIHIDGDTWSNIAIANGHARRYDGGKREDWCD